MKPIEFLQGKWLGHPLHPALVHIPVGAWIATAVIDVVERGATTAKPAVYLALYGVVVGLVGALVAVPTGVAEWSSIKKEKPAWKLGLYHMALNLLAAIVWAANLGLRWNALHTMEPVPAAVVCTSVVAAVLVIFSGYLGSLMVFDHGTSVARLSKKRWRRTAEHGGANLPEQK
jgi:uncharacterized membrane protein